MTDSELLAITRPEELFPGDLKKARAMWIVLSRRLHPDVGGSPSVFAHVNALYQRAVEKLKAGIWDGAHLLTLQTDTGARTTVATRAGDTFLFGRVLIADDAVHYLFDRGHEAYAARVMAASARFKYASKEMEGEIARYLPRRISRRTLDTGRTWIEIAKTPDLIRLRDLHTHLGPLDPRAGAWVISSLLNVACYLAWTGVVHHDLSPDSFYVSPPHHAGAVLGGWEHHRERGAAISSVPQRTFDVMPYRAKMRKLASTRTDLELVRLTAREVFARAPEPIQSWLERPNHAPAVAQYAEWQDLLKRAYGPRRFIAMMTTADDVYGEKKKGTVN